MSKNSVPVVNRVDNIIRQISELASDESEDLAERFAIIFEHGLAVPNEDALSDARQLLLGVRLVL